METNLELEAKLKLEAELKQFAIKCYENARQYETEWAQDKENTEKLAKAVDYYHLSAHLKNPDALFAIAGLYFLGRGVLEDNNFALAYYELAVQHGHPKARIAANSLKKNINNIESEIHQSQEDVGSNIHTLSSETSSSVPSSPLSSSRGTSSPLSSSSGTSSRGTSSPLSSSSGTSSRGTSSPLSRKRQKTQKLVKQFSGLAPSQLLGGMSRKGGYTYRRTSNTLKHRKHSTRKR
jgi:TPR repeat protein